MLHEELAEFAAMLSNAEKSLDVFPSVAQIDRSVEERLALLEQEYVEYMNRLNPERFAGNLHAQNTARHLLSKLYAWHMRAERDISTRGERSGPPPPSQPALVAVARLRSVQAPPSEPVDFSITTPNGTYRATQFLAQGDVAMLYQGIGTAGSHANENVVIKIAAEAQDNDLLVEEVRVLRTLQSTEDVQRKHLPKVFGEFKTPDGQAGTILSYLEGYDLDQILERYPQGLPSEHVAWILARALSGLGFAHKHGILHGNIEPAHLIVRPRDHNVFVIDWTYAVVAPEKTGQGFRAHNPTYSPEEVVERKPPLPASDLYSLGKTMIFLLGGDVEQGTCPQHVDERFVRFVQFLCRKSPRQRAQDAWEAAQQLAQLRLEVFGEQRFLALEM